MSLIYKILGMHYARRPEKCHSYIVYSLAHKYLIISVIQTQDMFNAW